jgi:hypothetical protein
MSTRVFTPEHPIGFGYKSTWLAIRSKNPLEVAAKLGLTNIHYSGWKEGINFAHDSTSRWAFISPEILGWILVVSQQLPRPDEQRIFPDACTTFLLKIGENFPDVQFFLTDRRIMFHAWARIVDGQLMRQHAHYITTIWHSGEPTSEEQALGCNFPDLNTIDWKMIDPDEENDEVLRQLIPGEADVINIAGAWSINPRELPKLKLPPSLGYVGDFP